VLYDSPKRRGVWLKTTPGQSLHGHMANDIADRDAHCASASEPRRANASTACTPISMVTAYRMGYDAYLGAHFLIASGIIECACRHLVEDCIER